LSSRALYRTGLEEPVLGIEIDRNLASAACLRCTWPVATCSGVQQTDLAVELWT
jgi:hypothetical protein